MMQGCVVITTAVAFALTGHWAAFGTLVAVEAFWFGISVFASAYAYGTEKGEATHVTRH